MDKRVFPAIDIQRSGTRKNDLLIPREDLLRIFVLHRVLNPTWRLPGRLEFPGVTKTFPSSTALVLPSCAVSALNVLLRSTRTLPYFVLALSVVNRSV